MGFFHGFSENLKEKLKKLFKKDKHRYEVLMKKIEQICSSDESTIEHYKNLRYDFNGLQRVHVDKSFVLTFKVDLEKKFILFVEFEHHDLIYKRK